MWAQGIFPGEHNWNGLLTSVSITSVVYHWLYSHQQVITDARAADMFRLILAGMAVSIVFLVCWSPLIFITQVDFWGRWRADVYIAAWSFANFNSCFNAMLYARFHKEYSVAYKLLLTCQWRKLRNESLNDEDYRNDFNWTGWSTIVLNQENMTLNVCHCLISSTCSITMYATCTKVQTAP